MADMEKHCCSQSTEMAQHRLRTEMSKLNLERQKSKNRMKFTRSELAVFLGPWKATVKNRGEQHFSSGRNAW